MKALLVLLSLAAVAVASQFRPAPYQPGPASFLPPPAPYQPGLNFPPQGPAPYQPGLNFPPQGPAPYLPPPPVVPAPYLPTPPYPAPRPGYGPGPGYGDDPYDEPAAYNYGYQVQDAYSGVDFSANEERNGQTTNGGYRVQLPDGRTQIVTYNVADGNSGFVADVRYEGEAVYDAAVKPYGPPVPAAPYAPVVPVVPYKPVPVLPYKPAPLLPYKPAIAPYRPAGPYAPAGPIYN